MARVVRKAFGLSQLVLKANSCGEWVVFPARLVTEYVSATYGGGNCAPAGRLTFNAMLDSRLNS